MATLVLTFDEILRGAIGENDAVAAKRWLEAGAPVDPTPAFLAVDNNTDCRVFNADFKQKRRRRNGGEGLMPAVEQPAAAAAANGKPGKPEAKRPAPTTAQRPQQQPQLQPGLQQQRPPPAPAMNMYSRAAFLSHGDAVGLASRRKGRGPPEFHLPPGWQVYTPGTASAGGSGRARQPASPSAAAAAAAAKQQDAAQQQQQHARPQPQQQYISPEGLVFASLQHVQAVVQGPVIVPRQLVQWLKRAAADPAAVQAAAATATGQAHLLGLCRVRVQLVEGDRRQMQQRLAALAGAAAGAGGGDGDGNTRQPEQQQRPAAQRQRRR